MNVGPGALRLGCFGGLCAYAPTALVGYTGIRDSVPAGSGLLSFHDMREAVAAIEPMNSDCCHRRAARALAVEWFAADTVLPAYSGFRA